MPTPLTGQDIIDAFEAIIDDGIDIDQELFLMNAAKETVETMRDWNFNRGLDQSNSTAVGDNYLSMKDLPDDFMVSRKLYLEGDINPWIIIPYEQRDRFKDIYKRYYIDYLNQQFALAGGSNGVKRISHFYARATPDIALNTSPVWPASFHKYLPFKMAEMFMSGQEADEINRSMSPANLRQANDLLKNFVAWDSKIKVEEYNAKNLINADLSTYPDVVGDQYL